MRVADRSGLFVGSQFAQRCDDGVLNRFGILVVDRLLFFEHRVQGGEVFGRCYGGQRRISGLCDGGIGIPGRIENDAGLILRAAAASTVIPRTSPFF